MILSKYENHFYGAINLTYYDLHVCFYWIVYVFVKVHILNMTDIFKKIFCTYRYYNNDKTIFYICNKLLIHSYSTYKIVVNSNQFVFNMYCRKTYMKNYLPYKSYIDK